MRFLPEVATIFISIEMDEVFCLIISSGPYFNNFKWISFDAGLPNSAHVTAFSPVGQFLWWCLQVDCQEMFYA